jgi:hypothetical protein
LTRAAARVREPLAVGRLSLVAITTTPRREEGGYKSDNHPTQPHSPAGSSRPANVAVFLLPVLMATLGVSW